MGEREEGEERGRKRERCEDMTLRVRVRDSLAHPEYANEDEGYELEEVPLVVVVCVEEDQVT